MLACQPKNTLQAYEIAFSEALQFRDQAA